MLHYDINVYESKNCNNDNDTTIIAQGPLYKNFLHNIDQIPENVNLVYSTWGDSNSYSKVEEYLSSLGKRMLLDRVTMIISSPINNEQYKFNNIFNNYNIFNQVITTINGINNIPLNTNIIIKTRTDYVYSKNIMDDFVLFVNEFSTYHCITSLFQGHYHRPYHPKDVLFGMNVENFKKTIYLALRKLCSRDNDIYCAPEQLLGMCFAEINGVNIEEVDSYLWSEKLIRCLYIESKINKLKDLNTKISDNMFITSKEML